MSAGETIGTKECNCGGLMKYTEGTAGGISGSCNKCKQQSFYRTPAAVAALKTSLATRSSAPVEAAIPAAARAVLGEPLDLNKL